MESIIEMTSYDQEELWKVRMRELSGAIAVSALFQVFLGYSGEYSHLYNIFYNKLQRRPVIFGPEYIITWSS